MKAVVLIGGQGTRLRPLTYTTPKSMVPVRNRPFIDYMVGCLRSTGLDGAVLSMGYLPHPIQQYFAEQDLGDFSLDYVVEEYPLGTAGGLKNAEESLDKGPLIATNGDILTGLDLTEIIEAHQGSDALATIALTSVEDPTAYGLVEVDYQLRVQRFVEKPGSEEVNTSLVNAGIYVLEREVLSMIPRGQEVSLEREIFPELQAMGKLHAYISSAYWRDIGTPRSYLAASHDALSGAIGRDNGFRHTSIAGSVRISKGVTLLPPVCIAEDCEIEAGATIGGRASMGTGCSIGEGATVEGSILFGEVQVGEGAIIRNSIVGPNVTIQNNAIVRGCSVLGEGCVVGEENVLDHGVRINPGICLRGGSVSF